MLCSKPYRQGVAEYGCGQCLPCRINARRVWTTRLVLEATQHQSSFFVTLTYNDVFLPFGGTLVPAHFRDFMKSLREYISPERIRFYGVGEYGERNGRPHYHVLLFGFSGVRVFRDDRKGYLRSFDLEAAWPYGSVHVGYVEPASCGYVAEYVVKKMTKEEDVRLNGRHPEFCRMSLRGKRKGLPGGIGAGATTVMADALTSKGGSAYVARFGDVPTVVRFDGKSMPVGRYLRNLVRSGVGIIKPEKFDRNVDHPVWALQRQLELRTLSARELLEGKRIATMHRAEWLRKFARNRQRSF